MIEKLTDWSSRGGGGGAAIFGVYMYVGPRGPAQQPHP